MEKITSENDIVNIVRDKFGSARSGDSISCYERGSSVVHIFAPVEREREVIDLLTDRNCRITRKCVRTRNSTDVVLEVMVGGSESGDILSRNFSEEEIYEGRPFRQI